MAALGFGVATLIAANKLAIDHVSDLSGKERVLIGLDIVRH